MWHHHYKYNIIRSQPNRSTVRNHLVITRHHSGDRNKFDFDCKRIWWEELNNELSAIQWESLLVSKTPEECVKCLTGEGLQTCIRHTNEKEKLMVKTRTRIKLSL